MNEDTTLNAPTRDAIRAAFFSGKAKKTLVTLKSGMDVEVRQPTVGQQLAISQLEDSQDRVLRLFADQVFIPNTDIKVFDPEDLEILKSCPAQGDYSKILDAIQGVMGLTVQIKDATKN